MIHHFVCYLDVEICLKDLLKCVGTIFNVPFNQIKHLLAEGSAVIKYEFTNLRNDKQKKGFSKEFYLYIHEEKVTETKIWNNLLLALELAKVIGQNIVINDESIDPFQYLLISNKREVFLVEEYTNNENESIVLNYDSFTEISLSKSLYIFGKMDFKDETIVFHLQNPKIWLE